MPGENGQISSSATVRASRCPGRGQGIGVALLERAHTYARNRNISVLLMHSLAENAAMIHLANKHGMQVETGGASSSARVEMQPASLSTIASELLTQRVALFDFTLRSHVVAMQQVITGQLLTAVTDAPYARARGSMTKAQEAEGWTAAILSSRCCSTSEGIPVEPPTVRRIVTIGV